MILLASKSAIVPTNFTQSAQHSQSLDGSQIKGLSRTEASHHVNKSLCTRSEQNSISFVDSELDARISSEALSHSYPFLDVKTMNDSEIIILKGRLTNDYRRICDQYNDLTRGVIRSLTERGITPEQLSSVLMDLNTFSVKKSVHCPLLQDQLDEIRKEESIDEAFYIMLRSYGSFFDCYILKYIVNALGTENDKAKLEQYERALYEYCQRNVFECPHFSNSDPNKLQLVLKLDEIVTKSFTLNALSAFQAKLADVLGMEVHTLLMCNVEAGCHLQITFQVPHFVVDTVISLTTEQKVELRKLGVIKVIVGHYTLDLSPYQSMVCCYNIIIPVQLCISNDYKLIDTNQTYSERITSDYKAWLEAWKLWAEKRKQAKLAKFILWKLEENVSVV